MEGAIGRITVRLSLLGGYRNGSERFATQDGEHAQLPLSVCLPAYHAVTCESSLPCRSLCTDRVCCLLFLFVREM
jgi:hypothetical protein